MSGYRRHSFDPGYYERQGAPIRPYNWVQWSGVALALVGLAIDLFYFAGRLGWTRPLLDNPMMAMVPIFFGIALINSRRHPYVDPAPELAAARKRWLIITVAVCAAILGAATVIQFTGA